jgi:hypothetical protein
MHLRQLTAILREKDVVEISETYSDPLTYPKATGCDQILGFHNHTFFLPKFFSK